MNEERLFLRKMRGIADLVAQPDPDEFELIRASGDYRHILLDGLLDSVNRNARLALKIPALPEDEHNAGTLVAWNSIALSPRNAAPGAHFDQVPPRKFERRRVISLMFEAYTVYDVIITSANFLGGVHHGPPTRAKEMRLQHLYDNAEVEILTVLLPDGSTVAVPAPIFSLLKEIGECLVDGLAPLVELLSARSN
ncbi:hypothetical protein [Arthrobacter sp. Leaf137]|uniref:hypothetical protein n=1 Tax=Arthrobacter sp. Leaf137 TaxID=1736271 RepID=UPI0006F32BB0|nr:hypothetical protein [Arthrobacter sp. Leaf137]KQQ89461.1 hypothetical protein ASF64_17640 [Arthrobacter sp. Leaf137]